jgi:serine/threonine protein kinase
MEFCPETLDDWIREGSGQQGAVGEATKESVDDGSQGGPESKIYRKVFAKFVDTVEMRKNYADFDWERVLNVIEEVISALAYIHKLGIAHRDLKPRNGISHKSDHVTNCNYSPVFPERQLLEVSGFRHRLKSDIKTLAYHTIFEGNSKLPTTGSAAKLCALQQQG